ncbi:MAG TPA: septum formation initiator family protein [Frankiaceae bacterium]|nr:septum formation initiator family protein [Frankiaceae bacterium]
MATRGRPSGPGRRTTPSARRPDARRRTTGTGTPKPPPAEPRRVAITTRAATLAVVLCVLALALTVPLRQYVAQRGKVARLRAKQEQAQARVDALEAQKKRLQDPAYVEQLARERLHFVRPGEVPYILLTPSPAPPPPAPGTPAGKQLGTSGPWYSRLWDTVETAGRVPKPKK